MGAKTWNDEQTELARSLLAAKASDDVFRERLGRSKACAYYRILRVDHPDVLKGRVAARLARKNPNDFPHITAGKINIPPDAFADAERRMSAPRSLTSAVFGDPPPGYSALDKRSV